MSKVKIRSNVKVDECYRTRPITMECLDPEIARITSVGDALVGLVDRESDFIAYAIMVVGAPQITGINPLVSLCDALSCKDLSLNRIQTLNAMMGLDGYTDTVGRQLKRIIGIWDTLAENERDILHGAFSFHVGEHLADSNLSVLISSVASDTFKDTKLLTRVLDRLIKSNLIA